MGRRRKAAGQGLPTRVYLRAGSFYYVHKNTGRWENLGRDLDVAKKRAEHFNDPTGLYGTMSWFLDQFLVDFASLVSSGHRSKRTLSDYQEDVIPLKAYFGAMLPVEVGPHHVTDYLDIGAKLKRGVRANRERACLSSCFGWMLRSNQGGLDGRANPCGRSSGVRRNAEVERDRYVTDDEYKAVFAEANRSVRLMMELVFRTLQRPEVDVLSWTPSDVVNKQGIRVLRFTQHKTKRPIDIALSGQLGLLIEDATGVVPVLRQPLVHNLRGEAYTYSGISAMLKQAQARVRAKHKALKGPLQDMLSFGFRDLKGKGATDMWLSGIPIERIQMLCGHKSKTTTEKYIKARWRETVMPNLREIA